MLDSFGVQAAKSYVALLERLLSDWSVQRWLHSEQHVQHINAHPRPLASTATHVSYRRGGRGEGSTEREREREREREVISLRSLPLPVPFRLVHW